MELSPIPNAHMKDHFIMRNQRIKEACNAIATNIQVVTQFRFTRNTKQVYIYIFDSEPFSLTDSARMVVFSQ